MTITATVEPRGSKFVHSVYEGGQLVDTRTSTKRYSFVHVQRWAPVGAEGEYGEASHWAARYASKPKPVGAKIEYGYCAGNIEITEAGR